MKAPIKWLKDYVDIDISTKEYAELMTLSGSKTEGVETLFSEVTKVVVGKILKIENHPDADKLVVCKVDVGSEEIQVVTGADNIYEGAYVPVALSGATLLKGMKIKKGKLRGEVSNGMLCSLGEMGLTKNDFPHAIEDGIFILDKEYELGKNILDALDLRDEVVEYEITSNRADCFSIRGLALESAVTLDKEFKDTEINVKEDGKEKAQDYLKVKVEDKTLCPKYTARVCKNIKIEPSPAWMRKRLKASGVRPINNIVDITNYVMLEYGQPMHAFDIKLIEGNLIKVKRAEDGEVFTTLDEEERKLNSENLVIADKNKTIALAGIMGGANSEINSNTNMIVFESANFNAKSVRKTAKQVGLRTESSSRFDKDLDVNNVIPALDRACQLIEELDAGVVLEGIVESEGLKIKKNKIDFYPDEINKFLGTNIDRNYMEKILKALKFEVYEDYVIVPTFRKDVIGFQDLSEEIARFYDYNNIKPTLLKGKETTVGKKSRKQKIRDIVRKHMTASGFFESYTFSFNSPKIYNKLMIEKENAVTIKNPLGEDYSIMRTTTYNEMLESLSVNYNRSIQEALLFELSYIYKSKGKDKLPEEIERITLGGYGDIDFYDIKGTVETLFDTLGISNYEFDPSKESSMHPKRTAVIYVNSKEAGVIGQVHPEVAQNYEVNRETYLGHINLEILIKEAKLETEYEMLPKFPTVNRDIAVVIDKDILAKEIEKVIKKNGGEFLERIGLFDVYEGDQLEDDKKSIAYSLYFRAKDKTLNEEDINKDMDRIVDELKNELGAKLR